MSQNARMFPDADKPSGTGDKLLQMLRNKAISALFCRQVWSVFLLSAMLVGLSFPSFGQKPLKTTLCAMVKNPQRFHRVLVQFRAAFEHGFENSILVDDAQCSKGIAPRFSQKANEKKQLENACIDHPGTFGRVSAANWVGVFRYHPNSVPTWTLDVREMSEITYSCESTGGSFPPIHLPESAVPNLPPVE